MRRTIRCGDIKDKLVFHDEKNSPQVYWQVFPAQGHVGIFVAESGPDWDRFIVIKKNNDGTHDVIFPRMMLYKPGGPVLLGKDKLQEKDTTTISCRFHDEFTPCFSCCARTSPTYTKMFTPVDDDYEYHIVRIEEPSSNRRWWGTARKEHCNSDIPLLSTAKYKAQVQRNQCRYVAVLALGVAKRKRALRDVLWLVARAVWGMRNKK